MVAKTAVQYQGHPAILIVFDDGPNNPTITTHNWVGISLGAVERAGMLAVRAAHRDTIAASREATHQSMLEKDQREIDERAQNDEQSAQA